MASGRNPLSDANIGTGNQNQMFQEYMKNPMQWLTQRNVGIPQQYANDPHGAVQYLLNSGRMSQGQLNQLTNLANQMGVKLS